MAASFYALSARADAPQAAVAQNDNPAAPQALLPTAQQGEVYQSGSSGNFRSWGATISANVPHPIFGELEHRFTPKWSMGIGAGGLAVDSLQIDEIPLKLSMAAVDARVRWHPWGGAFFLGAALGVQKVNGQASDNISVSAAGQTYVVNTSVTADIVSAYLTPHLGWLWIWKSGFTVGFDFGVQLPINPNTQISIATNNNIANIGLDLIEHTQQYQDLQSKVQNDGDKLGKLPLPYMTVLRLGWMF